MLRRVHGKLYTCWNDKRTHAQMVGKVLTLLALLVYWTTLAIALTSSSSPSASSLTEHADEIMSVQMYIILALVSGYVAIITWTFLNQIGTIKRENRESITRIEKSVERIEASVKSKVSIQVHNAICENKIEEEA